MEAEESCRAAEVRINEGVNMAVVWLLDEVLLLVQEEVKFIFLFIFSAIMDDEIAPAARKK